MFLLKVPCKKRCSQYFNAVLLCLSLFIATLTNVNAEKTGMDETMDNLLGAIAEITKERAEQLSWKIISNTLREDLCGYGYWNTYVDMNKKLYLYFPHTCHAVKHKWGQNIQHDVAVLSAIKKDVLDNAIHMFFRDFYDDHFVLLAKKAIKYNAVYNIELTKLKDTENYKKSSDEEKKKLVKEIVKNNNFIIYLSEYNKSLSLKIKKNLTELEKSHLDISINLAELDAIKLIWEKLSTTKYNNSQTTARELTNGFLKKSKNLLYQYHNGKIESYADLFEVIGIEKQKLITFFGGDDNGNNPSTCKTSGVEKKFCVEENLKKIDAIFKNKKDEVSLMQMFLFSVFYEFHDEYAKLLGLKIEKTKKTYNQFKKKALQESSNGLADVFSERKEFFLVLSHYYDYLINYNNGGDHASHDVSDPGNQNALDISHKAVRILMMFASILDSPTESNTKAVLESFASDINSREMRYWEGVWSVGSLVGISIGERTNYSDEQFAAFAPFGLLYTKGQSASFMFHIFDLGQYFNYSDQDESVKWRDALMPGFSYIFARKRRYPFVAGIDISYLPESTEKGIEDDWKASIFVTMEIPIWELN